MHFISIMLQYVAKRRLYEEWRKLSIALTELHQCTKEERSHLPPVIAQQLLISGEDHRFFRHCGFDVIAICRAIWRRIVYGVVEGASTIEQQLVRVLTGNYERTFKRKIKEILLATLVTTAVPKKDIPVLYLYVGYFGWRMNSFRQACTQLYLQPNKITLRQAAELVARLKYPQPHKISQKRLMEIQRRAYHLIRLHQQHTLDSTYVGLELRINHASV